MNLRVAAAGDPGSRRLLLYLDQVTIRLRDGTNEIVRAPLGTNAVVAAGNPFGASTHWLGMVVPSFSLSLSYEQRSAIARGVTRLELAGTMYALEPRIIATLPMEGNRSLTRDGTRLRIVSATPAADGGTVSVQSTSAAAIGWSLPFDRLRGLYTQREYNLVNEAHGEAVVPQTTAGGGSYMLVLPGMPLMNQTATLEMKAVPGMVRDAAWFKGARVALVEWNESGTYDVRTPIVASDGR